MIVLIFLGVGLVIFGCIEYTGATVNYFKNTPVTLKYFMKLAIKSYVLYIAVYTLIMSILGVLNLIPILNGLLSIILIALYLVILAIVNMIGYIIYKVFYNKN